MPRKSSRIEDKRKFQEKLAGKVPVAPKGKAAKKTSKHGGRSTSANKRHRNFADPKKPTNPKQRGYLEHFAKRAPFDVMLEIFSHLWPREMLYLSRTSKDLREILMSKSSTTIWRAARNNAGLPPLPPDLSEPQYASLAFDPYCHACGRGPCDTIFWKMRVKCHKKCFGNIFLPFSHLSSAIDDWSEDVVAMIELGIKEDFLPHTHNSWGQPVFLPSMVLSFYSQYKEVKHDAKSLGDWTFIKKREYTNIIKHNDRCEEWHLKKIEDRKAEIEKLRLKRANEIIGRLSEDGWDLQDLRTLESTYYYNTIYQAIEFSENTWPEIHAHLTEGLIQIMSDRLKREEKEAYVEHHRLFSRVFASFRKQDPRLTTIPIGDVLFASAKLNKLLWGLPCEKENLKTEFTNMLRDELPGIVQEWTNQVEQKLISILRKEVPNADIQTLKSVTSVFQCQHCSETLWYPFILGHICFRRGGVKDQHRERKSIPTYIDRSNWYDFFDPFRGYSPWELWCLDSTLVVYSSSANERIKYILSLCGFDPASTSMDEILKADLLLECSDCPQPFYGSMPIMGLINAVSHHAHRLSCLSMIDQSDPNVQAVILKELQSKEARIINTPYNRARSEYFTFFCKLCRGSSGQFDFISYRTLKSHMNIRHKITDENTIDESWELNPASRPISHSYPKTLIENFHNVTSPS